MKNASEIAKLINDAEKIQEPQMETIVPQVRTGFILPVPHWKLEEIKTGQK